MNKILSTILVIFLSGCSQEVMDYKEVQAGIKTCQDQGLEASLRTYTLWGAKYVKSVECVDKNNVHYLK